MARLKLSCLAAATLACVAGPAAADPITLVATLAPLIGGSAAAFIAGNLAYIALAGYALYSSNSAKRKARAAAAAQRSQYNASLQDRNVSVLSGEAPWQVVYGSPAPIGGSVVGIFTSGSRDQFKHLVIVYAAHECAGIDEVYIDGEPLGTLDGNGDCTAGTFYETSLVTVSEAVPLDGSGNGTLQHTPVTVLNLNGSDNAPIVDGFTVAGTAVSVPTQASFIITVSYTYTATLPRVNVQKHLSPGGVDTADAYLIGRCPEWTAADKLSGYAYLVVTLDLDLARFQGGPPNVTVKLRGKTVYDWRTGLTAYSANPVLCLADFLMSEAGFGATLAQIDTATAIAAANAADASGFRCDGTFSTAAARESTKQDLEDAFGGTSHQSGGVWRILPGAWTSPVMTLSEADLAAPIQINQASYPSKDRYNTVRGTYVDGAGLGVATDFTPWSNSAYVAADGTTRVRDVALPFTRDHQRSQDLARMIVERSRGGLSITIPGHMRLWPLQPGDRFALNNAEFGWSGKTFRMTDWDSHPNAPVTVTAVEDVAVFYDAAAVITVDAAPNTNLPNPFVAETLLGLRAASGTAQLVRQADGTVSSRVLLQWTAARGGFVLQGGVVQAQYRLASATDDLWQTISELPGDAAQTYVQGLQDGAAYLFRARFVSQLGIRGPWATIAHQVVGKTEPPSAPATVALTREVVAFALSPDLDIAGYRILYNVGDNTQRSVATPLHTGLVTTSPWPLPVRLYGINTVLVVAVDTSGNESVAATDRQDLGEPDAANIADLVDYAALGFPGGIINGSLSSGSLVADGDPSADIFGAGSGADIYYRDGAGDIYGGNQYLDLEYIATYVAPYSGGAILLDYAFTGSRAQVSVRTDGADFGDVYGDVRPDIYADDTEGIYGAEQAWRPWPGALSPTVASAAYQVRVEIDAGSVQGALTAMSLSTVMPQLDSAFGSVVIAAAGTFVNPAAGVPPRSFIAIEDVQITPIGTSAVAGRVKSSPINPVTGPQVELIDGFGVAVDGNAFVRMTGY